MLGRTTKRMLTVALWASACAAPHPSGAFFGDASGGTASEGVASEGGDEGDGGSGTTASADEGGGLKLDVAAAETGGPACAEGGECDGCTAVDVLFVIDNSSSMCTYQDELATAFPGFVDAMWTSLPAGTDLHVGITTSSLCDLEHNDGHGEGNCVMQESEATMLANYIAPTDHTVDGNGWQGRLLAYEGKSYFAADTGDPAAKAPLAEWFAGAATSVGCLGCSFDFSAAGAGYAAHPVNATANAGFVRDAGAVLLVFILSDEGSESPEGVAAYHDMIVAAKSECGGDDCIVSGGLLNDFCVMNDTNFSYDFLASFGEPPVWGAIDGFWGPPADYTAIVGAALAQVVAETCQQIPPQG